MNVAVLDSTVFEANRRTLLSAGMLGVRGRIQREGAVVHLVAQKISDLSADLASVGARDGMFPLTYARGDQAAPVSIRASCRHEHSADVSRGSVWAYYGDQSQNEGFSVM